MYALLVHDGERNELAVVRDHFGIKPLYWTKTQERFFFASEIKALVPLCTQVHEVGPGEKLIIGNASMSIEKYFDPEAIATNDDLSFSDASTTIKHLISEAVKRRVQTDLPVAVLLGGIDSAVILSQAIRYHDQVTAYTIGRDDNSEDVSFSLRLCKDLRVPLRLVYVHEDDILSLIPDAIHCIESFEPNHIRGGTFSYLISKKISQAGFRIALCGEGADELFGGYSEFASLLGENGYEAVERMRKVFVRELYKTQLKRVDRTAMASALEVRVPFLDMDVADYALSMPAKYLLKLEGGRIWDKYVLREAFRLELPDYALNQDKRVLSYGAGFGTNADEGPFYENAQEMLTEEEFQFLRESFPDANLRNREEAFYFKTMQTFYPVDQCPFLLERPFVNKTR